MEAIDITTLSNAELKSKIKTLEEKFEEEKKNLKAICEKMDSIEEEYLRFKKELENRKRILD